jgi:hypothetical protein
MRKTLLFFAALLCAWGVMAQNNKDPESSTFGLDEKDAAAVREIRYKMAQIRKKRPTVALVLSGGGALLPGLDLLVSRITGIRTVVAKHPLDCVAIGIGRVIESMGELSDVVSFRTR